MGALSWLLGGNDHQLAADRYSDRESASSRSARRDRAPRSSTFGRPSRNTTEAARQGQAWEASDRRRIGSTTGWFRRPQ
ncbi:hypothetical protein ACFZCU_46035 [Streptomyces canus]|uniref:hypothetical protein n=1 Tax=Streptomyces canus TaxID=58343 RepID=UPI0036E1A0E4